MFSLSEEHHIPKSMVAIILKSSPMFLVSRGTVSRGRHNSESLDLGTGMAQFLTTHGSKGLGTIPSTRPKEYSLKFNMYHILRATAYEVQLLLLNKC